MTQATEQIPKLRFPEFEGEWKVYTGEQITDKITKGSSPKWQGYDYQKTGVLFVTSENVRDGFLDISKPKFLPENFYIAQKSSQLKHGDVLINIVGASIGRNCVYLSKEKACINQAVALFRVKNGFSRDFVLQVYQHARVQNIIKGTQSESARPNLSLTDLKQLKFIQPSTSEQQKIASFLTSVDDKIGQLQRKKAALEAYKKGMMQQLFSQQIRFKDDQGNDFPDWEEKTLGDLGKTYGGLTGKTKDDFGEGALYIQYTQLYSGDEININNCGLVKILGHENQNQAQYGDLFFTTSSETQQEIALSSVLLDKPRELYLNSFCFGYRLNNRDQISPKFLSYLLKTSIMRRKIIPLAQGSTRYNISKKELMKITILYPHPAEQQKIADFLTALDHKIDLVNQELTQAQTFKKGLLQQMFI